jgi:hypothetical protein
MSAQNQPDSLIVHEALDRVHCVQTHIHHNIVEHSFYESNADFKAAVDEALKNLNAAYQIAGNAACID